MIDPLSKAGQAKDRGMAATAPSYSWDDPTEATDPKKKPVMGGLGPSPAPPQATTNAAGPSLSTYDDVFGADPAKKGAPTPWSGAPVSTSPVAPSTPPSMQPPPIDGPTLGPPPSMTPPPVDGPMLEPPSMAPPPPSSGNGTMMGGFSSFSTAGAPTQGYSGPAATTNAGGGDLAGAGDSTQKPDGSPGDGEVGGDIATAGAPPSAATPGAPATPPAYQDIMTKIGATQDPQQKAVLQDQLARQVFTTLKGNGHDVKWQGDQLMVDGRAYVVGQGAPGTSNGQATTNGGDLAGAGGIAPGEDNPNPNAGQPPATTNAGLQPITIGPNGYSTTTPGRPFLMGFETSKLIDPNKTEGDSGKYTPAAKAFGQAYLGGAAIGRGNLQPMIDAVKGQFPNAKAVGDDKIDFGDGKGPIDVVGSDGSIRFQNTNDNAAWESTHVGGAPGGPAPAPGGPGWDPGTMSYDPIEGAGAPPPRPAGAPPAPNVPTPYVPGTVGADDLAGFGMDENLGRMGPINNPTQLDTNYQAGQVSNDPMDTYSFNGLGDLGPLGAGRTQGETEDLVSSILAHPESMDPRTVEMLKAKTKDELADMQRTDDEDLTAAGYRTGNADSNWLQSEKLAAKGRRDQALVANNRNVDITAAQTNLADRKSAAALGQGFAESKAMTARADAAEKLAEKQAAEGDLQAAAASRQKAQEFRRQGEQINESLRGEAADRNLRAAQQNIDNQFKTTEQRQTAFKLAADTSLAAAAQRGDRAKFNETMKAKAAELGQSQEQLQQDYALALLHDATSRYGIDVGASIDRAKLAQAGSQFQQDLIFRLQSLKQQNDQFGAQYGLDKARTEEALTQGEYSRYRNTFGSGA